jgi:hypothetical protein
MIRQFIDAASPQERFAAVSELVGAGRVTELQDSLERSKKAWSTVTNQRQDELRPVRERLPSIHSCFEIWQTRAKGLGDASSVWSVQKASTADFCNFLTKLRQSVVNREHQDPSDSGVMLVAAQTFSYVFYLTNLRLAFLVFSPLGVRPPSSPVITKENSKFSNSDSGKPSSCAIRLLV